MNLSTSTSELAGAKISILRKLLLSLLAAFITIAIIEVCVRLAEKHEKAATIDVAALLKQLPNSQISGREVGNQYLVQNVALLSRYPNPSAITSAYIGTSRSKVLRPRLFGIDGAVNASGNSYNEISYGLLLQAEALRLQFPNLRRVYFEASLLLRRPAHLILEDDHRRYLPLLATLLPIRDKLPGGAEFRQQVETAMQAQPTESTWRLHLLRRRSELRLSSLLSASNGSSSSIPVLADNFLASLQENGERKSIPPLITPLDAQKPEITNDNIKVQRLRKMVSWAPWDSLFEMIALWGREHNIEVVLFQPPVRSDLYRFQLDKGLPQHVQDLRRISHEYQVPLIDLNSPDLHYMDDWSLFADEDHLETCLGSGLLITALDEGYRRYIKRGELLPRIERAELSEQHNPRLQVCARAANRNN